MKNIKNEKGSVAVIVLVTMVFFAIIMTSAYIAVSNARVSQLKETQRIKEIYEEDVNNVDNIYEAVIEKGNIVEKKLPEETEETAPYLPNTNFTVIEENLKNGIVIQDEYGNEYVWIVVPKKITKGATTISAIEDALKEYTSDYRLTNYTDTWYEGCGVTQGQYTTLKNSMLNSIKNYGGFWISKYEAGTQTQRKSASDTLTLLEIKKDMYPYNYVTVAQAQEQAIKVSEGKSYFTSLMFGVQWDLVLKYIELNGNVDKQAITTDSTNWGNYKNSTFNIARTTASYSTDSGQIFTKITNTYEKPINTSVILTTGATQRNKVLNIYDIAGNEWEWTLEKGSSTSPSVARGSCCALNGNASSRGSVITSSSNDTISYRVSLYK